MIMTSQLYFCCFIINHFFIILQGLCFLIVLMTAVALAASAPLPKNKDVAYEGLGDILGALGGPEGIMKLCMGLLGGLGGSR